MEKIQKCKINSLTWYENIEKIQKCKINSLTWYEISEKSKNPKLIPWPDMTLLNLIFSGPNYILSRHGVISGWSLYQKFDFSLKIDILIHNWTPEKYIPLDTKCLYIFIGKSKKKKQINSSAWYEFSEKSKKIQN